MLEEMRNVYTTRVMRYTMLKLSHLVPPIYTLPDKKPCQAHVFSKFKREPVYNSLTMRSLKAG
jgi:hypothetical protein